ncbi:MAG: hypothetical protein E3K36_10795 [Candidatus Brocadia sp.]|nr:hypothetical protein [Candidatus Brocadia sp.]
MTINFICCTITKPEERFKFIDSEIIDNIHIVSQIEKDRITPLIVDKNRGLRTDYRERISDQYRVNYFIFGEAYR